MSRNKTNEKRISPRWRLPRRHYMKRGENSFLYIWCVFVISDLLPSVSSKFKGCSPGSLQWGWAPPRLYLATSRRPGGGLPLRRLLLQHIDLQLKFNVYRINDGKQISSALTALGVGMVEFVICYWWSCDHTTLLITVVSKFICIVVLFLFFFHVT